MTSAADGHVLGRPSSFPGADTGAVVELAEVADAGVVVTADDVTGATVAPAEAPEVVAAVLPLAGELEDEHPDSARASADIDPTSAVTRAVRRVGMRGPPGARAATARLRGEVGRRSS